MPQTVHRDIGTTDVSGTRVTTGTDATRSGVRIDAATTDPAHIGGTDATHIEASGDTDASTIGTIDATAISHIFGEPATGTQPLGCQDPETPTEVGEA